MCEGESGAWACFIYLYWFIYYVLPTLLIAGIIYLAYWLGKRKAPRKR